jgi:hypothetical protein
VAADDDDASAPDEPPWPSNTPPMMTLWFGDAQKRELSSWFGFGPLMRFAK